MQEEGATCLQGVEHHRSQAWAIPFHAYSIPFPFQKWKKFKEAYSIRSATMQVLIEAPSDYFFAKRKQIFSKNKDIDDILLYAKDVHELFLGVDLRGKHATSQIVYYAQEKLLSKFSIAYSDYVPCPNDRLEDWFASHKSSKANISLVFLLENES